MELNNTASMLSDASKYNALAITQSHHISSENIEITGGSNGVYCKTDVVYNDKSTWGSTGYVMRKMVFKNLWIHDVAGEGKYDGHTSPQGQTVKGANGQDTVIATIPLDSVEVIDCIVERCGWDGIQISHSISGNIIRNNLIKDVGLKMVSQQVNGAIMGGRCEGVIEGNTIINAPGSGIAVFGWGNVVVKNNVLTNTGTITANEPAVYIRKNYPEGAKLKTDMLNNTITGGRFAGIQNASTSGYAVPGQWKDNIITNIESGKKLLS